MMEFGQASWASGLLAVFIDAVYLKGTLVVALGGLASILLRDASASARHVVWASVMVALLLLPAARLLSRDRDNSAALQIYAVTPVPSAEVVLPRLAPPALDPDREYARQETVSPMGSPPAAVPLAEFELGSWYRWVVGIWLGGALALLCQLGVSLAWVVRLGNRAWDAPDWIQDMAKATSRRLGLEACPTVRITDHLEIPGAFGLARSVVLLPPEAVTWPDLRLEAVLLHEFSHLRRRDFAVHVMALLVRVMYWVNPAVWLASSHLVSERERACDDGAVLGKLDSITYAEQLLLLARNGRGPVAALPILRLFGKSLLSARIRAILDPSQVRSPLPRLWLLLVVGVLMAGAYTVATVDLTRVFETADLVPLQLDRLADSDPEVRRRAAWALGELEQPRAVQGLEEALDDADPRVRVMAAWALGEIKDPEAGPGLIRALSDPEPCVQEMAVLALGEIQDPSARAALEDVSARPGLEGPTAWALEELTDAGAPVWAGGLRAEWAIPSNVGQYLEELRSPDSNTRALAAEKLGRVKDSAAVVPLMDALSDPEPAVRAMATWALDEINPTRHPTPVSQGRN